MFHTVKGCVRDQSNNHILGDITSAGTVPQITSAPTSTSVDADATTTTTSVYTSSNVVVELVLIEDVEVVTVVASDVPSTTAVVNDTSGSPSPLPMRDIHRRAHNLRGSMNHKHGHRRS